MTDQRGSIYGLFGIGELRDYRDPASSGMGMTGVAYPSLSSANGSNPALWGFPGLTMASGGFSVREISASSSTGSMTNSALEFSQLNLIFPIERAKLGLSASLYPISNRAFGTEQSLVFNTVAGEVNAFVENFQTGGVNAAELGIGYRINNKLSIGYAPAFVFGVFRESALTFFDASAGVNLGLTEYQLNSSVTGFQHKIGLYSEFKNTIKEGDRLALGLVSIIPTTLRGERHQETFTRFASPNDVNANRFRTEEFLGTGSMQLPNTVILGANYTTSFNLMIASEVLYQNWSTYSNSLFNDLASFKDRTKISLGGQYFYAQGFSYLSQFIYRFGVSYDTGHFRVQNQDITAWSLNGGIGIPSKYTGSSMDIVVQYGQRGTRSGNLIKESFFTVGLSVNLSEVMFYRPKLQ